VVLETMRSLYRRWWVLPRIHRRYRRLPLQETFQRIYSTHTWVGRGGRFSSGIGSYGLASDQYCAFVTEFVQEHGIQSVIDLGCGDFAVGRRITEACNIRYLGVDIVPELIEHHRNTFQDGRIEFLHADVTTDRLPDAELCLVRQVLQHLSNEEIDRILANLGQYPYVLISEEVPIHARSFNRDKPHGPDIRGYYGSGVWVEHAPFLKPISQVWSIRMGENSELRTVLLRKVAD